MDFLQQLLSLIPTTLVVVLWSTCAVADVSLLEMVQDSHVRIQATKWHIARAVNPTKPSIDGVNIVTIAGASKKQLREWMSSCPPPTVQEMHGTWRGLNRGVGAAMFGASQFVKHMNSNCNQGYGDNIRIKQVSPESWCCGNNWRALQECGELQRRGNYVIKCPNGKRPAKQALVLNYSEADNPILDPSRFIVDKIVKLSDRFLLGKARYEVGPLKLTIGYFVLERALP